MLGLLLACAPAQGRSRIEGDLPRSVDLGVSWGRDSAGHVVAMRVSGDGPAARGGLRAGDIVVAFGGARLAPRALLRPHLAALRAGVPVQLGILRAGAARTVRLIPAAAPLEDQPGVETLYTVLTRPDGVRLRHIVTMPSAGSGPRPAILYVHWLSCSPVDTVLDPDGWAEMIKAVSARSGFVVSRVERAGAGDSEGDCATQSFADDIAMHREALAALSRRPGVDPDRIFILGGSMGARMAPLVGRGRPIAGYVVWGGGAMSWEPYLLNHFEAARALGPTDAAAVSRQEQARLLREFLDGRAPEALPPRDRAAWRSLPFVDGEGRLFGRSHVFHREARASPWRQAWTEVRVPVLVAYGEFDWVDTLASVREIGSLLPAANGGVDIRIIPRMDHHFFLYSSMTAAYRREGGAMDPEPFLAVALPWLRQHARDPARAENGS